MARRSPTPGVTIDRRSTVEYVGSCVVCKHGIFSDQEHGRAPKPLLGKAHGWCGGSGGAS